MDDEQKFDGLKAARDFGVSRVVGPRKQTNSVGDLDWLREQLAAQYGGVGYAGLTAEFMDELLAVAEASWTMREQSPGSLPDYLMRVQDELNAKIQELRNA